MQLWLGRLQGFLWGKALNYLHRANEGTKIIQSRHPRHSLSLLWSLAWVTTAACAFEGISHGTVPAVSVLRAIVKSKTFKTFNSFVYEISIKIQPTMGLKTLTAGTVSCEMPSKAHHPLWK